ncbi:MAG: hypothetical protein IT427_20230 [Pirellulales bacterium]|nr:hypothetical protein [Pirellulales bacterium]
MKRLVEFSDRHQRTLPFANDPPDHRKYNPVERCWGSLENPWNGIRLASVDAALHRACTMTWRGIRPPVHLLDGLSETGVRLTKSAFRPFATRLIRSSTLPNWSVVIQPTQWVILFQLVA